MLGCPALRPYSNSKSLRPHHLQTLKCFAHMFPHRHPDKNLGEDTTTQMQHINNAYHRLLPDKGVLCGGKSEN